MGFFSSIFGSAEPEQETNQSYDLNLLMGFDKVALGLRKIKVKETDFYVLTPVFLDEARNVQVAITSAIIHSDLKEISKKIILLIKAGFFAGKSIAYSSVVTGNNFSYEIEWKDHGLDLDNYKTEQDKDNYE